MNMTNNIKEFRYKQLMKDPYNAEVIKYKQQKLKDEIRQLKDENIMLSTEVRVLREIIDRLKIS